MGSNSSKDNDSIYQDTCKYGGIYLKTDKQVYFTGETVSGQIYLNLLVQYPANSLVLRFKGKEGVYVMTSYHNTATHTSSSYLDPKKYTIIDSGVPLPIGSTIMPGQYVIPFTFTVAQNLPSSFHQTGGDFIGDLSYYLEAILEVPNRKEYPKINYKQKLMIRGPLSPETQQIERQTRKDIKSCGVMSKGSTLLSAKFDKSWYCPGETVNLSVSFDNSECKVDNKKIVVKLKQSLTMKSGYSTWRRNFTELKMEFDGFQAKQKGNMTASIHLPQMQMKTLMEEGTAKIYSYMRHNKETKDVMSSTTRGEHILSEYWLEVSCPMKNGILTSKPKIKLPIEICCTEIQPRMVSAPNDWNPTQLETSIVKFGAPVEQKRLVDEANFAPRIQDPREFGQQIPNYDPSGQGGTFNPHLHNVDTHKFPMS